MAQAAYIVFTIDDAHTIPSGPERTASSLLACCPGNLAPRKVPPGEDPARLRLAAGKSGITAGAGSLDGGLAMSTSSPGAECTLYHAGHRVHLIQVISASLPRDPRGARIVSIAGGIITVDLDGEERRFRNHATRRLRALVEELGLDVVVDQPRALLKVPLPDLKCFSIADAGKPWHRCRFDQLTQFDSEALAKRSMTHGGFTVPGRLLTARRG